MALTTNTQSQAEGVTNFAVGRMVTDSATAAAVTVTVGFVPRKIVLRNLTDRISQYWYEGMAALESLDMAANGDTTLNTTTGVTNNGDGTFTFTATSMVASKTYAWEAVG